MRTPALRALFALVACVTVAGIARAQVDTGLDRRALPRGRGWWCYPEALTTGEARFRCERRRAACDRSRAGTDAACVSEPRAFCVSYAGRDLSTSRPIHGLVCMRRARDCEAVRSRVYSEGRDMVVSTCTEAR